MADGEEITWFTLRGSKAEHLGQTLSPTSIKADLSPLVTVTVDV
jgi:hypothetical protein